MEDLQIKCNTPVAITMTEESVAFTMTENFTFLSIPGLTLFLPVVFHQFPIG